MTAEPPKRAVGDHYRRDGLTEAILEALRAAGKDPGTLTADDLAPVDQFHTRGRAATLDLARLADINPGTRVLDVGGGLGGPARALAGEFGCSVEVLDLTEEYCRAGEALTAMTNLSDRVSFTNGNALDMPYPNESFDLVWTQHSSMNIADKVTLYREIQRVLRPGGRLALHEIMAGPNSPVSFPVPWARGPSINHLEPPEAIRALIITSGFMELVWMDETSSATEWFRQRLGATPSVGPPLGLRLLLGPEFDQMFRNQVRNLEEARISVVQAIFKNV